MQGDRLLVQGGPIRQCGRYKFGYQWSDSVIKHDTYFKDIHKKKNACIQTMDHTVDMISILNLNFDINILTASYTHTQALEWRLLWHTHESWGSTSLQVSSHWSYLPRGLNQTIRPPSMPQTWQDKWQSKILRSSQPTTRARKVMLVVSRRNQSMSILKLLKCFCSKQKASKKREHEDKCQVPHLRGPRRLYIHLLRLLVWSSQVVVPWVDVRWGEVSVSFVLKEFHGFLKISRYLQVSRWPSKLSVAAVLPLNFVGWWRSLKHGKTMRPAPSMLGTAANPVRALRLSAPLPQHIGTGFSLMLKGHFLSSETMRTKHPSHRSLEDIHTVDTALRQNPWWRGPTVILHFWAIKLMIFTGWFDITCKRSVQVFPSQFFPTAFWPKFCADLAEPESRQDACQVCRNIQLEALDSLDWSQVKDSHSESPACNQRKCQLSSCKVWPFLDRQEKAIDTNKDFELVGIVAKELRPATSESTWFMMNGATDNCKVSYCTSNKRKRLNFKK